MFVFKLFSLNNIFLYLSYFIILIFIFFLSYKYLYLEQSIYLLTNKLSKFEIEYNNPSVYSNSKISSNPSVVQSAEKLMNDIFFDTTNNSYCANNSCNIPTTTTTNNNNNNNNNNENEDENCVVIQDVHDDILPVVNEIFDLKKDNTDDKISIISDNVGGGHATKKALMKLSIDKLKMKCEERKLPIDGTKNQLADKIIVHDNNIATIEISDIIE
jgi:hypothetical protein